MNDETLCFCGSGRRHADCHRHIEPGSLAAKLYSIQAETGAAACRACRSAYASRCFLVTETEFVQILDELLRLWTREDIVNIIVRSKANKRKLETEYPDLARRVNGRIPPEDLILLNYTPLPFPCVFLEGQDCAMHDVRPLLCREGFYPHDFLFLEYGDKVIFRRPLPLFFWFSMIFKDETALDSIAGTPFYRDLLSRAEGEYIKSLAEYEGK